ncbi:methyl-accepting chemotaxis protein [Butyricicoccus sp. 1XD8-22]|nr:methyl-accepting chemotaxis protein [Butyricicoccus sp. 1XD8-22]
MTEKQAEALAGRGAKRSLDRRILRHTLLNILILVIICCVIMALSLQSLANSILLDSLQPMARQSAKTVEANIHMLADRMMATAADPRINGAAPEDRMAVLEEAKEVYEFYTIAVYDRKGRLVQGVGDAPESLESGFFSLLTETDNLTIHPSTIFQGKLGVVMGMPVKEEGETVLYIMGVYKYDLLNDVISSINLGRSGRAFMVDPEGVITGHPDQSLALSRSSLAQSGGSREALDRVTTGETGAAEFPMDGEKMLVAFSPIRGTQWSLVIQIPKTDYSHFINWAMLLSVLATLVGLAVSLMLILRFARSISRPVKSVTNRMVALSGGDLHTEVFPVSTGDELEVMTQTLDATLASMNRYISDIQQVLTHVAGGDLRTGPQVDYEGDFALIRTSLHTITRSMNDTLLGFRAAADRLTAMAERLNSQSVQLHQASQEQNRSAEELVQEVARVKEQLADVTESSGQTRAQTEEITRRVQSANQQMSALSSAMDDISANAQQITKIAKDIEDIAFQTNILSLNASVEAARAGEAGKGFAVVASEVKQLAAQSAEAAQSATEMVVSTRSIIQTGVTLTANTAGSLHAISDVSDQISAISDQLAAAVQGQEQALSVMEERISTISAIADRNLQNAGETEQSSGSLAKEAEALQSQVQKFTLKEDGHR